MAKIKKATRKFQAKGGASAMLKKGTITKKGKLKRRKEEDKTEKPKEEPKQEEKDEGMTTSKELGEMDIDQFLNEDFLSDEDDDDEEDQLRKKMEEDDDDSEEEKSNSNSDSDSDSGDELDEEKFKLQLASMAEKDPDFMKHLEENDPSLLESAFAEDEEGEESEDEEDDDEVDEDDESAAPAKPKAATPTAEDTDSQTELTLELLTSLSKSAYKDNSIKSLKRLMTCYMSASRMGDVDETQAPYYIPSEKVYSELLKTVLSKTVKVVAKHLKLERPESVDAPIPPKSYEKSPSWPKIQPILQSFFRSTATLLKSQKSNELLLTILQSLKLYVQLTPDEKTGRTLLKSLVGLWSSANDGSDDNVVRLEAFLRIRQLALTQPFPFIEDCLKSTYLAYAKFAKFTNESTLPTITFLGNCIVELYSLDADSAYQHAFIYIRALALHLRAAVTKKTKEAFKIIYCWQYFNSLKLWSAVAANLSEPNELRELIYPLVELILGVGRLMPTVRNLPIRLHLIRLLQQLAASSEQFIPTSTLLLDMLTGTKELTKKLKGSTAPPPRLPLILKLPKDQPLPNQPAQDVFVAEIFTLLGRDQDLYRYSVAYPELSLRVTARLRKFLKETSNPKWRAYAKGCVESCESYATFAAAARAKLGEAPKDVKNLERLKPFDSDDMGERLAKAVGQEKRLEEIAQPRRKEAAPTTEPDSDDEEVEDNKKRKKGRKDGEKGKVKKQRLILNQGVGADEEDLDGMDEDVVQEGLDWSDED
ncbi:hypothetical protein TrVE_jg10215 [Triparma verrucosa]|uniref:Nucleolar complex protein 2 homolog n=1 Tax=Triparma verrucosa TaxID=1606542 RepID=A0A9W7KS87_9STRA|nr:hypothetical protein TrVE_jg10215 [Triparma verrucosa]